MVTRSLVAASLLSLFTLAAVGCAAPTEADQADDGVAEDDLTAAGQTVVGRYFAVFPVPSGFVRLTLEHNGTYRAEREATGLGVVCVASPCVVPENGTWTASKTGGKLRVRITPAKAKIAREYDAVKSAGKLELTSFGTTETLTALASNQCLESADCGANEECAAHACTAMCVNGAAFCCGVSTCAPKKPTTTKHCGGFSGLTCAANEVCIDDPFDSCNPAKGGRDCAGICAPKTVAP